MKIGADFQAKRLDTPLDKLTRKAAGKRSFTLTAAQARPLRRAPRPMQGRPEDLAFDATIRTAAPFQRRRARRARRAQARVRRQAAGPAEKVRVRRAANLVLFVVDASWSMAAAERMEATKGAIISLLHDAYQRRDQVGLVVFQREEARVVLPPTSSVELAQQRAARHPGRRQDAALGRAAGRVSRLHAGPAPRSRDDAADHHPDRRRRQRLRHRHAAAGRGRPHGAIMIQDSHLRTIVINMEHPAFDRGLAQQLANALGGPCYTLPELKADTLVKTVRKE